MKRNERANDVLLLSSTQPDSSYDKVCLNFFSSALFFHQYIQYNLTFGYKKIDRRDGPKTLKDS